MFLIIFQIWLHSLYCRNKSNPRFLLINSIVCKSYTLNFTLLALYFQRPNPNFYKIISDLNKKFILLARGNVSFYKKKSFVFILYLHLNVSFLEKFHNNICIYFACSFVCLFVTDKRQTAKTIRPEFFVGPHNSHDPRKGL